VKDFRNDGSIYRISQWITAQYNVLVKFSGNRNIPSRGDCAWWNMNQTQKAWYLINICLFRNKMTTSDPVIPGIFCQLWVHNTNISISQGKMPRAYPILAGILGQELIGLGCKSWMVIMNAWTCYTVSPANWFDYPLPSAHAKNNNWKCRRSSSYVNKFDTSTNIKNKIKNDWKCLCSASCINKLIHLGCELKLYKVRFYYDE